MSHTSVIEYTAAAFGVLGTVLLALNGPRAGWGFLAYLVSNAGWITFASVHHHWGMLGQQIAFVASSLLGIWVWLVRPRLTWDEWRGDLDGRVVMRIKHLASWRGWRLDLHQFIAPDTPECFHTHPAKAWRVVLWGGYWEEIELTTPNAAGFSWRKQAPCKPGHIGVVLPQLCHRIHKLINGRVSYSLWLRWPKTHDIQLRGSGWGTPNGQIQTGD